MNYYQIALGLLSYLACNTIWFLGEAQMLKLISEGKNEGIWFGILGGILSFPICLFATWILYKNSGSWFITQAPSVVLNIVISYVAFSSVLGLKIGIKEIVAALLVLAAALVMSIKTETIG